MKRKRIIPLLVLVWVFLASGITFAGDPKPNFFELRVKSVNQLPEFWTNEDGAYTARTQGQAHTVIYFGNATLVASLVNDDKVTVKSGWQWVADVNGIRILVNANTEKGAIDAWCYAHYIDWGSDQIEQVLAMIESTLQFYFERHDYEKTDRVSQGLLRIPELSGGNRSKYSSMRRENFVRWIDRKGKCKDKVGLLERALRTYAGDSLFTSYLATVQGVDAEDCGGITSSNLGLFTQSSAPVLVPPAPTVTPVPPTPVPPTPVPPSPTPILPTATPQTKIEVVVVRVTVQVTSPPQPTAIVVPVARVIVQPDKDPPDDFGKVLQNFVMFVVFITLVIGVGRLAINWYHRQKEKEKLEKERGQRQREEAKLRFNAYVLEAKDALRCGRLGEARQAIINADPLREAHPQGADILRKLNAQLKQKEINK